jgi:hypothetical protein
MRLLLVLTALCFSVVGPAAAERTRSTVGDLILESPPELRVQGEELARQAARILPRLEAELGSRLAGPFHLLLIPPEPGGDPEIARLDAAAPPWAAGFVLPTRRVGGIRVSLASRYPYGDLRSVLVHEITHMLLHDAAGGNLPRWFDEGVATRAGRRWGWRDRYVYSTALLTGGLPSLDEMDSYFRSTESRARTAYAGSFDLVSRTVREHGEGVLREIIAGAATRPFPVAWEAATGIPLARAEAAWRRGSLLRYRWIPALTGTTTLWIGITMLALFAVARRRARSQEILERWEREEGPRPEDETLH